MNWYKVLNDSDNNNKVFFRKKMHKLARMPRYFDRGPHQ